MSEAEGLESPRCSATKSVSRWPSSAIVTPESAGLVAGQRATDWAIHLADGDAVAVSEPLGPARVWMIPTAWVERAPPLSVASKSFLVALGGVRLAPESAP